MSWAHVRENDPEWDAFVSGNARGGGLLVFGRITYEMMASYWPSPMAAQNDPIVAERMNNLPKLVFSRSLGKTEWRNARLAKDGLVEEIRRRKAQGKEDMAIMGSGSLVAQLTQEGLIDEFQIAIVPVILGEGRTMFEGVTAKPRLKLLSSRSFDNGNVFLRYAPTA